MIYKFCPVCAGKLSRKIDVLQKCLECGFHLYDNPKFSASAVVGSSRGEILLAKRRHEPGKGLWNTPGGFINPGETAEQAVRRELFEETGIRAKRVRYLGSFPDRYVFNGIKHNLLALSFGIAVDAPVKIRPGDDALELKFFAPSKIPWTKIGIPSDIPQIKEFIKLHKRGYFDV